MLNKFSVIHTHGAMPYLGMNSYEVLQAVQHDYHMLVPKNCPDALCEITLSCWKTEPGKRPFEYLKYQLANH